MQLEPAHLVYIAFWTFGLVNNVLYVVILTAAVDLVGPQTPKAVVLLADVLPSFLIKLAAPFLVHRITYDRRIGLLVGLSTVGMLSVSLASPLFLKLVGVVLASFSSGLGEVTFLQLTHFYDTKALNGWSSGTGGAGLVGSGLFMLLTTVLGVPVKTALLVFAFFPLAFLGVYFYLLPPREYNRVPGAFPVRSNDPEAGLETQPITWEFVASGYETTMARLKPLVLPYMLPLFLVYFSEYTINQGIAPTLLFPLEELPFSKFRDVYVTYGTLYQLGVFISRSSAPFVRIRRIMVPSVLQFLNLVFCIAQSISPIFPNVWLVFILIFYEGLLGGAAYVNTFMLITEQADLADREFALGSVGMSDSAGIVLAGLVSLWLEPGLCNYQVNDGRNWCTLE
ncbi:Protein BTN1 [Yarrowia sp. B02]|nr:Protein BTN1 [Yarrowia sp. B02]